MSKYIAAAVLLLAAAAAVLYYRYAEDPLSVAPAQYHDAPIEFTLSDLDGRPRQLSEWAGKARLVNFWATWCAPCRREIPLLNRTQLAHTGDNLQVIGVAVDFVEDVRTFTDEIGFEYPVLVGQDDAMAAAESAGVEFIALPFTMIVAPDGHLVKAHIGEIHEDQITRVVAVFERMRRGELDLEGARAALKSL